MKKYIPNRRVLGPSASLFYRFLSCNFKALYPNETTYEFKIFNGHKEVIENLFQQWLPDSIAILLHVAQKC